METKHFLLKNAEKNEYENAIKEIALILKGGGLVAVPTETVYGLAASALNEEAVKEIFAVKGRPQDNPLIVHVAEPFEVEKYAASVPPLAKKAIDAFMPGPFTAILPKKSVIPSVTTAGMESVALRCPSHKIMHDIIAALSEPIAAPSANISGKPSPTGFSHCVNDLEGRVSGIVDGGESEVGVESTVVSFLTDKAVICRPGAVTYEMLSDLLGAENVTDVSEEKTDKPISPGMKYRHYSPSVPLYTVSGEGASEYIRKRAESEKGIGVIGFSESGFGGMAKFFDFGSKEKPKEQLARLFAILREADKEKESLSLLLCERPDKKGEGKAALNRLDRAASHKNIAVEKSLFKIIAVTGKSGSGKSAVAREAAERLGYGYIDCDAVANEIIWNFPPLTERIKEEFSVETKKELSKKVFSDKEALLKLNFLTLPVVISEIDKIIFELSREKSGVIVDGATVIESGFAKRADKLVVIKAEKETAVSRIIGRDGIEREAALARIDAQKPDLFYEKEASRVIENNGSLEEAVTAFASAVTE